MSAAVGCPLAVPVVRHTMAGAGLPCASDLSCSLPIMVTDQTVIAAAQTPRGVLIATLLAAISYGLLTMTICLPSMTTWSALFGVDQASVQLSFSAFVVAYGGAQVFYGPLSDRHGRRNFLLFGFAVAALGGLAGALAVSLPMLIAARAVQGLGAAAGMVIGRAMVQDYFSDAERPRMMAYTGMVLGMCPPIATILGGQIHVHFGWRANFVLMAVLAVVLLITTWRVLPPSPVRTDVSAHWLREMGAAYRRLARVPIFLSYTVILSCCSGAFYVFIAGLPLVLAHYGVGPARLGWYIMVVPLSYICGNFLTSRLLRTTAESRLVLTGQYAGCAGIVIVLGLALAGVRSPLAVALPFVLLGFGHGLIIPPTLSGTVSVVPALAGSAAAVTGLSQQMLGAIGSWLIGYVSHEDAINMALIMLMFMLTALLAQFAVVRLRARMDD